VGVVLPDHGKIVLIKPLHQVPHVKLLVIHVTPLIPQVVRIVDHVAVTKNFLTDDG
jgi:hypothetical protein